MHEALLWKKEGDNIRCSLCAHRCLIPEGKRGFCFVRENRGGKLYSLVYGKVIAAHLDPIEKKPLYHFHPGSAAYSIASVGCNFRCSFCQNWDISQMPRDNGGKIMGHDTRVEAVVEDAELRQCKSIAYTYNEPTICYEFYKDCSRLAHDRDIRNVFVSNGYMTKEMIDGYKELDAANIDLKAFTEKFYRETCAGSLEPVLETLKYLKKKGIWTEVTTLIVPGQNDSEDELSQIAEFISKEVSPETPWHISAFHPDYKMRDNEATPVETLTQAYKIGKDAGLHYVYVGNVAIGKGTDTECPNCGETVIRRKWMQVIENRVEGNKCPNCGHEIAGRF
jgi:pyruvate formate lyase activating enzyme